MRGGKKERNTGTYHDCMQTDAVRAQRRRKLHTSAYVSIRQHTSAHVSIRQRSSAYVSIPVCARGCVYAGLMCGASLQARSMRVRRRGHTCVYAPLVVSIRQHTPAYASIRQYTPAYVPHRGPSWRSFRLWPSSCPPPTATTSQGLGNTHPAGRLV